MDLILGSEKCVVIESALDETMIRNVIQNTLVAVVTKFIFGRLG